ncbi:hypothetical protein GCM10027288_43390 [Bordetella tumbae]
MIQIRQKKQACDQHDCRRDAPARMPAAARLLHVAVGCRGASRHLSHGCIQLFAGLRARQRAIERAQILIVVFVVWGQGM